MSQPEFELHYAELKREIDALVAELAESKARKHFVDVKQRIETLYETLRVIISFCTPYSKTAPRAFTPSGKMVATPTSIEAWRYCAM